MSPYERKQNVEANNLCFIVYVFGSGKLNTWRINYRNSANVKFLTMSPKIFALFTWNCFLNFGSYKVLLSLND
jgi:hypothetical protein